MTAAHRQADGPADGPGPDGAHSAAHRAQQAFHGTGHDYVVGSPHLHHAALRRRVEDDLRAAVAALAARHPDRPVQVLEVGAGHGPFTSVLLDAGAHVTVTEMSAASADALRERFGTRPDLAVVHDPDASWAAATHRRFDAVVCVSVLHHVPDYLAAITTWTDLIAEGGTFVSWQDPLLYARVPRWDRWVARTAYLWWRLGQGEARRGLATALRRARGHLDEDRPEDMSEYHVVRNGVDEAAVAALLRNRFAVVAVVPYWSTHRPALQRFGDRHHLRSEFAVHASGRRA